MEKLIHDINSYIKHVEDTFGLEVTLCDLCSVIYPYFNLFAPYTNHRCHFCIYLKKTAAIRKKCVLKQGKIREKCLNHLTFSGTCHAGVGEFIFRIMHKEEYIGFISVGEFCLDKKTSEERIIALNKTYRLPLDQLNTFFDLSTKREPPSVAEIERIITPLVRMLELFYLSLKEMLQNKNDLHTDYLLNSIILYLTENFTNDIQLDDIANALNYSKYHLCHYFFEKRNMTIMYYVQTLRIEMAKKLLKNEDLSINDIAYQVGFNDSNYFTNTFKKHTGMSPRQYRKQVNP